MCILISTINVHFKEEKLPLVINDILNMGVISYCIKINDEVEKKRELQKSWFGCSVFGYQNLYGAF